jgi:hypothetical protein
MDAQVVLEVSETRPTVLVDGHSINAGSAERVLAYGQVE